MRVRFTRALKQQKLNLNDLLMKIDDFGMSRDVQTALRSLRKRVLTDSLYILKAFGTSCKGLVSDLASFGAECTVDTTFPPFPLGGRN